MTFNTFRLPCLRYKIMDSKIYRSVGNDAFETKHKLVGPQFGDFHLQKNWVNPDIRVFDMSQGRGSTLRLEVRRFVPPKDELESETSDDKGVGGKGRNYYSIPWAVADLGKAIKNIYTFIDESVPTYTARAVGSSDSLVSRIFREARRLAYSSTSVSKETMLYTRKPHILNRLQNTLVRDTLRFWTAARFLEGGWRSCGEDKFGAEKISPPWRPKDEIALPPYIDYQFASILMEKVLAPVSERVLKRLDTLIKKRQPSDWYSIFLSIFILMHSFELIMAHEVQFTKRRNYPVCIFHFLSRRLKFAL